MKLHSKYLRMSTIAVGLAGLVIGFQNCADSGSMGPLAVSSSPSKQGGAAFGPDNFNLYLPDNNGDVPDFDPYREGNGGANYEDYLGDHNDGDLELVQPTDAGRIALHRYYLPWNENEPNFHRVTVARTQKGFIREAAWDIYKEPGAGRIALYECWAKFSFLSGDPDCEGHRLIHGPIGYIAQTQEQSNFVAIYRCYLAPNHSHFVSPDPECERSVNPYTEIISEGLIGYAPISNLQASASGGVGAVQ